MSSDPQGDSAKTVLWLTLAAPGIWLAFLVPQRGGGEGIFQVLIMGASLVVAAILTELVWHKAGGGARGYIRLTRPTAGPDWRILTNALAIPRRASLAAAVPGCASLGAGWKLASRIELVTRSDHLRRHGPDASFWVGDGGSPVGGATVYSPGASGGSFRSAAPTASYLALCMLEAAAEPRSGK